MKVFKKVFAFAIALTAIAMATSAMAATVGTATYDSDAATVAATTGLEGTAQATVAVVPTDFGADTADAGDIYYINQDTAENIAAALEAGVGLKDVLDVPSAFEVRVGGNGEYDTYVIQKVQEVSTGTTPPPEDVDGKRFGFHGAYQFNGGSVTALKFILASEGHDADKYNATAEFDTNSALVEQFLGSLPSVVGEVTFGLEVANVPAGVTVTLTGVDVVE